MEYREMLAGIFPPVMTPFTEDQKVDYDALAFNIEKMNETSLRGYMPLGSNGEFRSLSDEESLEVARTVKRAAAKGKTLMFGASRESAYATAEMAKALADIGADCISVLTPYYFAGKMDDDALLRFYTYVADRSPVPVLAYNAPKFAAGVMFSPVAVTRMAAHPNIIGMKDTTSEDIAAFAEAVPDGSGFYVLAGSITKFLKGLRVGAVGGVLSVANYFPEECCRIQALWEAGQEDEAAALSEHAIAFNKRTTAKTGVAGVKAAMDLVGYRGGWPRNPLLPLSAEERAALRALLVEEGYLS